MAGGLFGRPFVLNEKCIIFSIIIMALFLYKPNIKSNLMLGIVLFGIFVVSYVAMAWYDYYFGCDILPLKRGELGVTEIFKPGAHEKKQKTHEETTIDSTRKSILIYVSHIILVVPLLLYIAYYRGKVNPLTYPILVVLAVMTAMYHGIHLMLVSH